MLDAARAEAADEPDVLYDLSQEYARLGLPRTAEEVLEQVLALDPAHAGASNDLGYAWAEQGRNLERAEALAREAVKEEPGQRRPCWTASAGCSTSGAGSRRPARRWSRRSAPRPWPP